jgi:hypothetical protein
MTTGDDRALELRDMALTVVRRRGKPGRGLASFDGDGFRILYRSQFDQLAVVHEPTDQEKFSAAAKGEPPPVGLPEALDVFFNARAGDEPVLTMNWNSAKGRWKVWRYRPGTWEAELERLAG